MENKAQGNTDLSNLPKLRAQRINKFGVASRLAAEQCHIGALFGKLSKVRVHSFGTILVILIKGLGITEYTEFQFRKERQFWKRNTHGGGDLRTTMSPHAGAAVSDFPPKISQKNAYSVYSE